MFYCFTECLKYIYISEYSYLDFRAVNLQSESDSQITLTSLDSARSSTSRVIQKFILSLSSQCFVYVTVCAPVCKPCTYILHTHRNKVSPKICTTDLLTPPIGLLLLCLMLEGRTSVYNSSTSTL